MIYIFGMWNDSLLHTLWSIKVWRLTVSQWEPQKPNILVLVTSLCSSITAVIFSRGFYRATLCVSTVFADTRYPSVCPSVTLRYCIQRAKDVFKFLYSPGIPIILVFDPERRYSFSRETLPRGAKYWGWGKFAIFDLNRRLCRKRYEIGPWNSTQEVIGGWSIYVGSDNVERPWKAGRVGSNFQADLLNNARTFDLERPNSAG